MSKEAVNTGVSTPFTILARVLARYFPTVENGGTDRSAEFVSKFRQTGGTGLEFEGLLDDIKAAAATPELAAELINSIVVGGNFTPDQAQAHLYELHDQLAREGLFSDDYLEKQQAEQAAKRPDTEELMAYYAKRRLQLPGALARLSAPLWVYLVASGVAVGLGSLGLWATPVTWGIWSQILRWPMVLISAIGFIGLLGSSATMASLRNERLHPPKPQMDGAKESFFKKALRFR